MNLAQYLNCRIDVYGKEEIKNKLGEIDYRYQKIKAVWANIKPLNGNQMDGQGNTVYAEISHKFIIRKKAIACLSNDMYFVLESQRYDIKYFMPNYTQKDRIEVYCKLVVE